MTSRNNGTLEPMGYPGNLKYDIQASVREKYDQSCISEAERRGAFAELIKILFTHHLTLITSDGKKIEGALVGDGIDLLIGASVHFYRHRRGTLSVSDYVTDILDIARVEKIAIAFK